MGPEWREGMAFLTMLTGALRSRPPVPAIDTTDADPSTGVRGSPSPAGEAPETGPATTADAREPGTREQQVLFHLSNVSHGVNHFQNQMMTMLWPAIMAELGLSYMQVGVLSAISS